MNVRTTYVYVTYQFYHKHADLRLLNKKAKIGKRDIFLSYSHVNLKLAKQVKVSKSGVDTMYVCTCYLQLLQDNIEYNVCTYINMCACTFVCISSPLLQYVRTYMLYMKMLHALSMCTLIIFVVSLHTVMVVHRMP